MASEVAIAIGLSRIAWRERVGAAARGLGVSGVFLAESRGEEAADRQAQDGVRNEAPLEEARGRKLELHPGAHAFGSHGTNALVVRW